MQKSMEMEQNLFENVIATLEGKSSGLCPTVSSAWKTDTLQKGIGYNNGILYNCNGKREENRVWSQINTLIICVIGCQTKSFLYSNLFHVPDSISHTN